MIVLFTAACAPQRFEPTAPPQKFVLPGQLVTCEEACELMGDCTERQKMANKKAGPLCKVHIPTR